MSIEQKNLDLLDNYFNKVLSVEEEKDFIHKLNSDAQLKNEFEFVLDLQDMMRVESNVKTKILLKEREKSTSQLRPVKKINSFKWLKIAAGFALAFAAFNFLVNTQGETSFVDLYDENFTPYPNDVVRIERGDSVLDELNRIFIAYGNAEYEYVVESIDKSNLETDLNQNLQFYKAVSLMALDKNVKAEQILNNLNINAMPDYFNQIHWYSALNAIKAKDKQSAVRHLQDILSSEDSFRKTSAKKLLQAINK